MATINDIAAKLGISKSTVSKGLNNATDISEAMRKRVLETAAELGYNNKRLTNREKRLCILMENMEYSTPEQFGHDIILGFRQLAENDGWIVDVISVDTDFQFSVPYSVFMLQSGYLAAFVLGFTLTDPWMSEFNTSRIPAVLYDNYIDGNPKIASVGCDCQEGFEQAVRHLLDLGHKKIGMISGSLESYIAKARYQAYMNALSRYNLETNQDYIGVSNFTAESTGCHAKRMHKLGITAIVCSHDVLAVSAITECTAMGIRVPEDLSIIGYDDLPMTAYTEPPLTTIRQDRAALGKAGYYAMSCLINELPLGSVTLRAPLILRGSTGPAHTTA